MNWSMMADWSFWAIYLTVITLKISSTCSSWCWAGLHEWEERELVGFLDTYRGVICKRSNCGRLRSSWKVRNYE